MMKLLRTTPEKAGIGSAALARLVERLDSLDSLNSIMLMRGDKVFLEGWWKPYSPETPHMIFSLSKSFVSAAIGMAVEEKRLKLSDKLLSFFPEFSKDVVDDRMREVSLRHLLTMTSGHAECAKPAMERDPDGIYARGFLSSKLAFQPGERFAYNSAATYMLAAIVKKVSGLNVREYLTPRLFAPLGIVPGIWESDPRGVNFGGWGLYLTTEHIAKFANLLLHGGRFEGKQLIPADYLAEATRKQSDNSMNDSPDWKLGYGYQFWISQHGYRGDGASGQYAIVVPEKNLAIATTSCIENMQSILTALWEGLLPFLEEEPLPENPAAREKLLAALDRLAMKAAPAGTAGGESMSRLFEFKPNPAGIESCAAEFGDGECALTFKTARGFEQLRAGFGSNKVSVIQLADALPHPTGASATWISESVLEIRAFCLDGTFRDVYRIDFNDRTSPLTRASRCSTFRPEMPPLTLKRG